MLKFLLLLLFVSSAGCLKIHNVADKKFATAVHDDSDTEALLIRKVHFPTWQIYYAFNNCSNAATTAEQKQYHEKTIADYLKIWINPLRQLTNRKLIGDQPSDFEFIHYTGHLSQHHTFKDLPRITEDADGHELAVIIDCQASGFGRADGLLVTPPINSAESKAKLLKSLGHTFGLLDTHNYWDHITNGMQAASVMGKIYTYDKSGTPLLGNDDIKGIEWLYRFFHKKHLSLHAVPMDMKDCFYVGYIYVENEWEEGACRPRDLFIHLLGQAHVYEKNHSNLQAAFLTLEKSIASSKSRNTNNYNIDAQDKRGNTGLHYAVLLGAWSLWSKHDDSNASPCQSCEKRGVDSSAYDITKAWQSSLAKVLEPKFKPCTGKKNDNSACVEVNKENNRGDTALHYAASTGYTKAVKMLLARQETNLRAKNKYNEIPCSLAQKPLIDLQEIGLISIKVKSTKIEQLLQAIRAARTEIVKLLTRKGACEKQPRGNNLAL